MEHDSRLSSAGSMYSYEGIMSRMSEVSHRIVTSSEILAGKIPEIIRENGLGEVQKWSFVEKGLEDCNIHIVTHDKSYLLKIFSKLRLKSDIDRLVSIIGQLSTLDGLTTQKLVGVSAQKGLQYLDGDLDPFVLLDWVEGMTFADLGRKPTDAELRDLMRQIVLLQNSEIRPEYSRDSWAVSNISSQYEKVKSYFTDGEQRVCEIARDRYNSLDVEKLPKTYVHGDISTMNLVADGRGGVGIIDFSVSNMYPRIQDLSGIIAYLVYSPGDTVEMLGSDIEGIVRVYEEYMVLTDDEKRALPVFIAASFAMLAVGATTQRVFENETTYELDLWKERGLRGLKLMLALGESEE